MKMVRGGLGFQTGRGKSIKAALLTMAVVASGACNGWGPGARLRAPVGVQWAKPPGKFGVLCNFRVWRTRI